jgi:gluconolactonase
MNTSRRTFLTSFAVSAATTTLLSRDWSGQTPERYPDPDVIVLEPEFEKLIQGNSPIRRLHTGMLWAEGPAWNGSGNYLVWSDIPNNAQMRYLPEDGHVSVLRNNANNSNGNTFDLHGRQISFEHATRRVVRYELDGKITVLADKFEGKPLNAPNDGAVHADGSVWFTDPGYGSMMDYEGNKGELLLKEAVYRIDPSGEITKITEDLEKPNGLCFSPDYKKVYVADTGAPKSIRVYDVDGKTVKNGKDFVKMAKGLTLNHTTSGWQVRVVRGDKGGEVVASGTGIPVPEIKKGGSDGIRCDIEGNLWASAGWVGDGFDGVHVFNPGGTRIGMIKLPETASNLCFGGPKRNRLFITASQSLYSLHVNTRGAHHC